MKRFILKLLLFCCVPLAVLLPLEYMINTGLKKSQGKMYAEWNDLFAGRINADMLIMGSSRAWVHFSPKILDSALGLNTYNLGLDAALADLQYKRLQIYLKHNKAPKYIVHEVGLNNITIKTRDLPNYQQFLPYLSDPLVWQIYKEGYNNVSLADRYFPLYKYNNQLPTIKEGLLSFMGKVQRPEKYKGYQGQELPWDSASYNNWMRHPSMYNIDMDTSAIALFKEYVRFCKERNIRLILVYAPFYAGAKVWIENHEAVLQLIRGISTENKLPFMDYTNMYLDSSTQYYYNSQHLNKAASEEFSRLFANDVRKYLNSPGLSEGR